MRLLFIRHAESEENYFMESLATKYRDGLPQPFNFWDERKPQLPTALVEVGCCCCASH